jgi:hypothetical protein
MDAEDHCDDGFIIHKHMRGERRDKLAVILKSSLIG